MFSLLLVFEKTIFQISDKMQNELLFFTIVHLRPWRIFDFFSVRSILNAPNEHQKHFFLTSGGATSENTTFGVHERKKNQSYTEKVNFSISFMIKNCKHSVYFNTSAITTETYRLF